MHTTLYIDIDEEITSIIDRVRKSDVSEIIIVAPKNALLLQSAVNLRLLKKEGDRRKKHLLIITQDKIGKKLIEKAGIMVQSKPGNDVYLEEKGTKEAYEPMYREEAEEIKDELQKEEHEKKSIGTSDYFEQEPVAKEELTVEEASPSPQTKPQKKKDEKQHGSRVRMSDIVVNETKTKNKKQKKEQIPPPEIKNNFQFKPIETDEFIPAYDNSPENKNVDVPKPGRVSMKKAEKFFRNSRRRKKEMDSMKIAGSSKKFFAIFIIVFVLLAGISAAYFFLPKATLALQMKSEQMPASATITALSEIQEVNTIDNKIPVQMAEISKEMSESFPATGTKNGAGKASGKVVIYNEFSTSDQPLVATTRLQTEDGKIFRITQDVVVPGMTEMGSEAKPGAIEASVVADQPGDGYNIGPATFKIPGFQNNKSKFDKFYAKSSKVMEGGNSEGITKVITAQDISSAKEKISGVAKNDVLKELKNSLPQGETIFDDSLQVDATDLKVSDPVGTEKDEFSIGFKMTASALGIQDTDVKKILAKSLLDQGIPESDARFDKPIDYLLDSFDNQTKMLKFSVRTEIKTGPDFNADNFKKGLLGKSADEAMAYAKNFPEIEKMNISFWPFFVSRIPPSENRITIEIE